MSTVIHTKRSGLTHRKDFRYTDETAKKIDFLRRHLDLPTSRKNGTYESEVLRYAVDYLYNVYSELAGGYGGERPVN